jgi:acyl-CoA synthetase (NDP forming)
MSKQSMKQLFEPESIVVVGASEKEGSLGGRLIQSLIGGGYEGKLLAVHPTNETVFGVPCYRRISEIGGKIDFAALALPDAGLIGAAEDAVSSGVGGFFLPGRAYDEAARSLDAIPERLRAILSEAGASACGHNCMGFWNVSGKVRMTHNPPPGLDLMPGGGLCVVSHSGSSWSGITGSQRDLALDIVVSAGAEIVTGMADYIDYYASLPTTRVIAVVLETIREPEAFMAALARAEQKGIPVVLLSVGVTSTGARFTEAHSGGLASPKHVLDALSRKHGVILARHLDELLDIAEAFRTDRVPTTGEAGIISDSGGERQLIADFASLSGIRLAQYAPETDAALAEILGDGVVVGNPLDSMGGVLITACGREIAGDEAVGAVVVGNNLVEGRSFMQLVRDATMDIHGLTEKPVFFFGNIATAMSRDGARYLRERGVPVFVNTSSGCAAIAAFMNWHDRHSGRAQAQAEPKAEPGKAVALPRGASPEQLHGIMVAAGIPMAETLFAGSWDEARAAAARLGYPLVLKTANPEIAHKTDAGGVALNLASDEALKSAAAFGARVVLQRFVASDFELIVGAVRHPRFGPLITLGVGGIFTEILADSVTFIPPVSNAELASGIAQLRAARVVDGARGRQGADREGIARMIGTLFAMMTANPDVSGIEFNPVMVRNGTLNVVDCLVTYSNEGTGH